jgi:glutathione S-transferase
MSDLHLISHNLCPYVQRAVIALTEKQVAFRRRDIDLGDKPDWFLRLSPFGKTPVLTDAGHPIFESAVILEYLEETQANPMHPDTALLRARNRGWIEFGSSILADIAGLYSAKTETGFTAKIDILVAKFTRVEAELSQVPYFEGEAFGLVDAAYAPIFRYFETMEGALPRDVFRGTPKLCDWRAALARRASVRSAVAADYPQRLREFLEQKDSYLARILTKQRAA